MKKKPAKTLRVCSECTERKKMLFDAHNRALQAESALKAEIVGYSALENACEMNFASWYLADSALREELLKTAIQGEEIEKLKNSIKSQEQFVTEMADIKRVREELRTQIFDENDKLRADLAHSDTERRKLERDKTALEGDVMRQQARLAIYAPFRMKSKELQ
jgi:hypothetical protein